MLIAGTFVTHPLNILKVLGYGIVFNEKFKDAYESHKKKFEKSKRGREKWQDQMFCSIEDRINEYKKDLVGKGTGKGTDF